MTLLELLVCALLVLTSAFLSSSEIALFSLSRFQVRGLKDRISQSAYRQIRKLLQDPGGLLIAILVLSEVVNISLSTLITRSIALHPTRAEGSHWLKNLLLGSSITTLIILLFCEITPKVIGAKANRLIAALSASFLSKIYDLTKPIRIILTSLISILSRTLQGKGSARETTILKESEFLLMVEEGQREGAVQQAEVELIKNVFELDDTRAQDIITPLAQVRSIQTDTTIKNALSMMRSLSYSRIPVTTANRRQIVGILYTKDMLRAKLDQEMMSQPVSDLMRKPVIVSPSMQLNALFRRFKQNRNHMAVVQKPTGETLGIVTMNDVLESLFGDLLP